MVDKTEPWFGGGEQPTQQPAEPPVPVDRRRPQEEQALNAALVLAGLRGAKREHAVRFADLERLEENVLKRITPAARIEASRIANQIAAQQAAINAESQALVQRFTDIQTELLGEVARLDEYDAQLSISFTQQIGNVTANLEQNYYTIAEADTAIAAVQTNLDSSVGDINANLSANYYTRAGTDSAIATQITSLSTTIAANYVNVTTYSAAINGITGVYGIEIDNNGYVSGFGLISDLIDGNPVADFVVRDASFRLVNSSGSGSGYTPFAVYPWGRTVDGAFIPAGVHADDLYVTRANIGQLAVDTLRIDDNAVTIPVVNNRTDAITGDGLWKRLHITYITLDQPGYIYVFWNGLHGYAGVDLGVGFAHSIRLNVDFTQQVFRGGNAIIDYPNISWSGYFGTGTWAVEIEWLGSAPSGGASMNITNRNLLILGAKK